MKFKEYIISFLTRLKNWFRNFLSQFKDIKENLKEEFGKPEAKNLPEYHKELDYFSDSKRAMYAEQSASVKILIYGIVGCIFLLVIWAYFAVINEVTMGTGKVIPSSNIKSIQSLDGGILQQLYVKEGQIVKINQLLAKLNISDYEAEYSSAKKHYYALLAKLARLNAEAERKNEIDFPSELKDQTEITKHETALFNSRKENYSQRIRVLQDNYDLMLKQVKINEPLVKEGVVAKIEFLQLQSNLNTAKGNLDDEENKFHNQVLDDTAKYKDELQILHEKIIGLRQRIARSEIRSPVYGIVKNINVTTIGGVIKPGGDVMQIVPLEDSLLIEAKINPSDIAFIHPGQEATIRFTAYDYSIYGTLNGKVEYISADTVSDEKDNTYYLVRVKTDRSYLGTKEKPLNIIPGMIAIVDIVTGKKTIANYILKPILKGKYEALREK